MSTTTRKRLDPRVFDLPLEKMCAGYYTDAYFNHTRAALLQDGRHPRVLCRSSRSTTRYLGGMDEAIAILQRLCADDWVAAWQLEARALRRRRDRAVRAGADDRGRLHARSRTSRRRTSARSRDAR